MPFPAGVTPAPQQQQQQQPQQQPPQAPQHTCDCACEGRGRRKQREEEDETDDDDEWENGRRARTRKYRNPSHYDEYTHLMEDADVPGALFGVPKHVFNIRETTKLILFAGVAILVVVALDMSTKMVSSAAAVACSSASAKKN